MPHRSLLRYPGGKTRLICRIHRWRYADIRGRRDRVADGNGGSAPPTASTGQKGAGVRPARPRVIGSRRPMLKPLASVALVLAVAGVGCGDAEAPQASADAQALAADAVPSCWPFVGIQEGAEGPFAGHGGMLESDLDDVEAAARGFVQAVEVGDLEEAWWQYDDFEWAWSFYLETAADAEAACVAYPETVDGIRALVDDLHTEMVVPLREGCHAISTTGWSSDDAGAHEFDHCRPVHNASVMDTG